VPDRSSCATTSRPRQRALACALLLGAGVLASPAPGAGDNAAPSLPPGLPAADKARIDKVLAKATVSTRVEIDPYPLRLDVVDYLLDHPEFATQVTRALKLARYRIWRTADGLNLDDGWGVIGIMTPLYGNSGLRVIYARGLTPESHGNAVGIGLADIVSQRLVDSMDPVFTYTNAISAMTPAPARISIHFPTDRQCLQAALRVSAADPRTFDESFQRSGERRNGGRCGSVFALPDRIRQHTVSLRARVLIVLRGDDHQLSARFFSCSSLNRRTFSIAITAWWANVSKRATCRAEKGPGSVRPTAMAPIALSSFNIGSET